MDRRFATVGKDLGTAWSRKQPMQMQLGTQHGRHLCEGKCLRVVCAAISMWRRWRMPIARALGSSLGHFSKPQWQHAGVAERHTWCHECSTLSAAPALLLVLYCNVAVLLLPPPLVWLQVRNAAALTFTALLLRVVGARNIDQWLQKLLKPLNQLAATPPGLHTFGTSSNSSSRGGSSGLMPAIQGPSAVDFFNRYPQLHTFLLQQLQEAVQQQQQQQQQQEEAGRSGSSADTVPPSLFPALIVLSRLRPLLLTSTAAAQGASSSAADAAAAAAGTATAAAAAQALDPAVFVPAVVAVGQSAVLGVRSMAAAALAPLVPVEQLHAVCSQLASVLSAAAAAAAAGSGSESAMAPAVHGITHKHEQQQQQPVGQNALHGSLLQLTALLAAASNSCSHQAGNAGSSAAAVALVQQLLPAFVRGSVVLTPGAGMCCAVKQQYITAAGQLLVLSYKLWPMLQEQQQDSAQDHCSGSNGSNGSAVELLRRLVLSLQESCLLAVTGTVPAAAAGGSSRGEDVQDPLYSCWLRDSAALLLGPLLQLQLLLHNHSLQVLPAAPAIHHQTSSSSSSGRTHGGVSTHAAIFVQQLQLLAALLPPTLQSSSYEVQCAALKATGVQLSRLLAVAQQLHGEGAGGLFTAAGTSSSSGGGSGGSSGSNGGSSDGSAAAEYVQVLASSVWGALQQGGCQLVKVTKRLLVVWGYLQQLQQLMFTPLQHPQQQQQQGPAASSGLQNISQVAPAAAVGGVGGGEAHVDQLLLLTGIAERCREPEAASQALLCAARAVRQLLLLQTAAAGGSSSGSGSERQGAPSLQRPAVTFTADGVQATNRLCMLVGQFGLPDKPEQLRAAAAEALQVSGLLLPLAQSAAALESTQAVIPQYPAPLVAHTQGSLREDATVTPAAAAVGAAGASSPQNGPDLGPAVDQKQTQQQQQQQQQSLASLSLRCWFLVLMLMEDEEEEVRQAAAAAAQQALQLVPQGVLQPLLLQGASGVTQPLASLQQRGSGGAESASTGASQGNGAGAVNGTHAGSSSSSKGQVIQLGDAVVAAGRCEAGGGAQYVAAVQGSCFALLARCRSRLPELQPEVVRLLLKLVLPVQTAVPQVLQRRHLLQQQQGPEGSQPVVTEAAAAAAATAAEGEVCVQVRLPGVSLRRLFEREADNHHEEPLLLAQHAAAALWHALGCTLEGGPLVKHPPGLAARTAAASAAESAEGTQTAEAPKPAAATAAEGANAAARVAAAGGVMDSEVEAELQRWCNWALQQFLPAVVERLTASAGSGAAAGDVHHPEVYVPLFRCCLGLWAVGPWLRGGSNEAASDGSSGSNGSSSGRVVLRADAERLLAQLYSCRLPEGLSGAVQAARDGLDPSAAGAALFLLQ